MMKGNFHETLEHSKEFHIHIDGHWISQSFENFLVKNHDFIISNFPGHPEGIPHYEPVRHLTKKIKVGKKFHEVFDSIENYLETNPKSIEGYIEGEYVPVDIDISEKDFNPEIEIPCQFQLTSLTLGTFREDEIHITLSRDESDAKLIDSLRRMGFFSAYAKKTYGAAEVLTVQGTYKQIQEILPKIVTYLEQAGGAVKCSVKEERIVRWWLSSSELSLPPVLESVNQPIFLPQEQLNLIFA
ncbi:hypothetical protein [Spirulina sp. 06S082]|uniref:hypothetical protein n=1 Tax=Spirulina sp. 06S082 TaxID=3110248 RepID=UPI002B1F8F44|nr:hypothetical protein [Spirulina sp. 06S082]MEA5472319.1 hypothetical protein [Spirulina sp. 06S082]